MTGQPFDLDAAAAVERGEPWTFAYGGRTFQVVADLPLDVLEAYASFADAQLDTSGDADSAGLRAAASMGPIIEAMAALFTSPEDYAAFRAMHPGQAELTALLGELTRRSTGATLGEASAPSTSSSGASPKLSTISGAGTG